MGSTRTSHGYLLKDLLGVIKRAKPSRTCGYLLAMVFAIVDPTVIML